MAVLGNGHNQVYCQGQHLSVSALHLVAVLCEWNGHTQRDGQALSDLQKQVDKFLTGATAMKLVQGS